MLTSRQSEIKNAIVMYQMSTIKHKIIRLPPNFFSLSLPLPPPPQSIVIYQMSTIKHKISNYHLFLSLLPPPSPPPLRLKIPKQTTKRNWKLEILLLLPNNPIVTNKDRKKKIFSVLTSRQSTIKYKIIRLPPNFFSLSLSPTLPPPPV